jgi:acetyl-CoA carboxylase carboxyl transferase subunit alpha
MPTYLEFEKPVADLEGKVAELRAMQDSNEAVDVAEEIARLEAKSAQALSELYTKLSPWQKTLVARHPERPRFKDYCQTLVTDYVSLAGDRCFADDAAIQAGIGRFRGQAVAILGQERGSDTASRLKHNFGMARPEGYRKAIRIMQMADRFGLPVLNFVDTAGAYPGIGAEERGQAQAIATSIEACLNLGVPNIAVIIGEGGSGGAIAIATANTVIMLEHSVYSVISPEGAASILWRDPSKAPDASQALKITAQDLQAMHIIDAIVEEPIGGAHRDRQKTIAKVGNAIEQALGDIHDLDADSIKSMRNDKFLTIGRSL